MTDITKAIMEAKKTADAMKAAIGVVGAIGGAFAVLGAVASLASLFLPDPVMLKLDEISGQITSLESQMNARFDDT